MPLLTESAIPHGVGTLEERGPDTSPDLHAAQQSATQD